MENIHIVRVINIVHTRSGKYLIVGKVQTKIGNLYETPFKSEILGVNVISGELSQIQYWIVEKISAKLFRMPYNDNFVVFPILHTIS